MSCQNFSKLNDILVVILICNFYQFQSIRKSRFEVSVRFCNLLPEIWIHRFIFIFKGQNLIWKFVVLELWRFDEIVADESTSTSRSPTLYRSRTTSFATTLNEIVQSKYSLRIMRQIHTLVNFIYSLLYLILIFNTV